jgi:tetratricopeptide (TPR) repeat protein
LNLFVVHFNLLGGDHTYIKKMKECYFQLGEPDEALAAWQKSLEINQNQPQIKKSVEALKEKK